MFTLSVIYVFVFGLTVAIGASVSSNVGSNGCILPKYPRNGRWSIGSGANYEPGEKVDNGVVMSVICYSQFRLNGSSVVECSNGKWSEQIGQCLELCPPIVEKHSTIVACTTVNGENTDCSTPTNGTVATIKCAPYYENEELNRNPFRTCKNGKWNEKILSCSAVCGLEPTSSRNSSTDHFYPWNVLIYRKEQSGKKLLGVGTLITDKTILTSATALMDYSNFPFGGLYSYGDMRIAAGKTIEDFEEADPEHLVQYSRVLDLFVLDHYRGYLGKFHSDIAIIIARVPFKMTRRVQLACIDWSNKYSKQFVQPGIVVKVPTPLKSLEHSAKRTHAFEILFPKNSNCEELFIQLQPTVPTFLNNTGFLPYFSFYDSFGKFCIENFSVVKISNCGKTINPGVGLFAKDPVNEKYYIVGVASLGSWHKICTNTTQSFAIFTRVNEYISFISEKTNLYSIIERDQFQTTCGIKSVQAQPLIVNGNTVAKGEYPWQVAIYEITNSKKNLICGGSLINSRVILTAAHCVTDNKGGILPKEKYIVAVGKYYRKFDDSRDNQSKFSALKQIIVPTEYKGEMQNYLGDLAILISETSFEISTEVQPICIDWEAKYEGQFLKPNVTGFVAGWGFTEENQSPSQELKDLEVPYVEPEQCKNELPLDYEIFLTNDKLCSGILNQGKSVCRGDSGGGLVFKNKNDDRYYLAGVVSVSPQSPTGGCYSQQYTLYTKISHYTTNFILKPVSLYWS